MFRNLLISFAILAALGLSGCGSLVDGGAVKGMLESAPLDLSNEQVVLTNRSWTAD